MAEEVDQEDLIEHERIEDDIDLKMHTTGSKEVWTQLLGLNPAWSSGLKPTEHQWFVV